MISRSSSRISGSSSSDLGSSFVSVRSGASSDVSLPKSRQSLNDEEQDDWRVCLTANLFESPLENRFLCVQCLRVLQHPVSLSSCDHFVCSGCLGEVCRSNRCRCPQDSLRFKRHECLPDSKLEKELNQLTLECPHKHCGCVWVGKLQNYQGHFESCLYTETLCSNGCGRRMARKQMDNHLSNECSLRTVDCEFCHRTLKAQKEIEHLKDCPKLPVSCPNSCGKTNILREELNNHLNKECTKAEFQCSYLELGCNFKGSKFEHTEHVEEFFKDHVSILCESIKKQAKLLAEQENLLKSNKKEIDRQNEKLALLLQERETQMLWKIDKWSIKAAEAKSGKRTMLHSVPFLTGKHQYKLSLVLFPNGDRTAKNKYLSLYVRVCKGEYDNLLSWPFSMEMDLILVDQSQDPKARSDHTYTLRPNPCKDNLPFLGKPIAESNPAFGMQNYVSLDLLESRDYVRDDTVFIRICVRPKKNLMI